MTDDRNDAIRRALRRPHTEPPSSLDRIDRPAIHQDPDLPDCGDPSCDRCGPVMHDIPEATFDRLPHNEPKSLPDRWSSGHLFDRLPREPRRYRLLWWWRKTKAKRGTKR